MIEVGTIKTIDYQKVFNHIPTVSYIIENDDNYTIRFMSKAIEQLTGFSYEHFNQSTFYRTLIHQDDLAQVIKDVSHATQLKKDYTLVYRITKKNHEIIWVIEKGKAVYDAANQVNYYVGMIDDITESVEVESLLKHRESLLEAILKATEIILSAYDYNSVMHQCFDILGKANHVHRIYYYQNSVLDGLDVTSLKHEWVAHDIVPHIDDPDQQNIPLNAMMDFFTPLLEKKPYEAIVDEIKDDILKSHLQEQQIESILIFPIYVNHQFEGFIGFDDVKVKRLFTPLEKNLLSSFSKSIETAIERNKNMLALREQTAILETVFEAIEDGVALIDVDYKVQMINDAMKQYIKKSFVKGMHCHVLFDTSLTACENCPLAVSLNSGKSHTIETSKHYGNNQEFLEIHSYPIIDSSSGEVTAVVQLIRNITERKKMHDALKKLSETDTLTGLYNRGYIDHILTELDQHEDFYIISIDVDGLKIINDMFGHSQGDDILKTTSDIIRKASRKLDTTIARIGGDEFIIVLKTANDQHLSELLSRLKDGFDAYNNQEDILLSTSIGVAKGNRNQTAFEVLKTADSEMYSQKLRKGQSAKSHIINTLLETLKTRDITTRYHGDRLVRLITEFARVLDMSDAKINQLQTLAQVHDVGKIGIPDSILLKPSKLTDEEWKMMKTHPEKGYRITSNSPELAMISEFVLKHHEYFDGTGYPLGITGNEIPIESRILLICDAYDAMTSERPYRKAMSKDQAIQELISNKGKQFDPELVDYFIEKVLNRVD